MYEGREGGGGSAEVERVLWCLKIIRMRLCSSNGFSYHEQKRSTEGCSKFKGPETRQVQERLVSTLEHMQVPKWDRTRCPEK